MSESAQPAMSAALWPDRSYLRELRRPWKLATFAIGMGWLVYGALNYGIGDWNLGDSLIMGGLTYLTAPWSVRTLLVCLREGPKYWWVWSVAALLVGWAVVDGSYLLYNVLSHHPTYRWANFYASSLLYLLAGAVWQYRGSVNDFIKNLRDLHRPLP
jgi:hypothetical protein